MQGFAFTDGLMMLILDVFLLGFAGYYLDQVIPKQYGVAKPWNFICVGLRKFGKSSVRERVEVGDEVQD